MHQRASPLLLAMILGLTGTPSVSRVTGEPGDSSRSESGELASLHVYPKSIDLRGPHDYHRIVVWGEAGDGARVDVTAEAEARCADAGVAAVTRIDAERRPALVPAGDGVTRLVVRWRALKAEADVRVRGYGEPRPPSLTHDVVSRLTRAGCNAGSCHGAQHGRGSFKLSLLGYEPDKDLVALTQEGFSRRIDVFNPERSLLLQKPLGVVPHEGGKRFERGSTTHRALRRWIEARAPAPPEDEPGVTRISVFPREWVLAPETTGHFVVSAHLSDGSTGDVTGRALISSLNDGIAQVDAGARISGVSSGQTGVMVRYQGQAEVVRVVIPYPSAAAERTPPSFTPRNFIDELAARKWRRLGLEPSAPSSDGEFIRRVYLTTIGTLPTPGEVKAFLDDTAPEKRDRLIDRVLDRPEYVDYWSLKWGDILRINRKTMNEKGMWSLYNWLRTQLRANRPLDEMVAALVTAQGSTYTSGPANFFRVAQRPKDLAETTSQIFLGVRMQCAQCHHHPFEKWTQQDYWGLAAYFARLGIKSSSEFGVYGREKVVYVKKGGEVRHPRTGRVVPPKPLDAAPQDDPTDRRRALARWLVGKENRMFCRNLANRLWGYLLGRGIVEPLDDLRVTNPPSNAELLDALANHLVESGFDQKKFLRTILRSRVFQLSSQPTAQNGRDQMFFSHYLVRRLPAEVLHDAICSVTEVPESFSGMPPGSRAIQLPDPQFTSYFLNAFGKPKRVIACECERVSLPNITQALHLINGDFIQKRVSHSKGRVARAVKTKMPDAAVITDFYLAAFSRRPRPDEAEKAAAVLAAAPNRREGLEDLLWAMCNSTEFLFNH